VDFVVAAAMLSILTAFVSTALEDRLRALYQRTAYFRWRHGPYKSLGPKWGAPQDSVLAELRGLAPEYVPATFYSLEPEEFCAQVAKLLAASVDASRPPRTSGKSRPSPTWPQYELDQVIDELQSELVRARDARTYLASASVVTLSWLIMLGLFISAGGVLGGAVAVLPFAFGLSVAIYVMTPTLQKLIGRLRG
jgi:hypothetical protein